MLQLGTGPFEAPLDPIQAQTQLTADLGVTQTFLFPHQPDDRPFPLAQAIQHGLGQDREGERLLGNFLDQDRRRGLTPFQKEVQRKELPAGLLPDQVLAMVQPDPGDPGPEGGSAPEGAEGTEGLDESHLGGFLGLVGISQKGQAKLKEVRLVRVYQFGIAILLARQDKLDDLLFSDDRPP